MLKRLLFLFAFFTYLVTAKAFQPNWAIVDSLDTSGSFWGTSVMFQNIKSFNSKEIIALANVGVVSPHIIKSTDEGFNWEIKLRFEEEPKRAFNLSIDGTGLAIFGCQDGIFFISNDYGETWEKKEIKNKLSIDNIGFWDNFVGLMQQMTLLTPPI